MLTAQASTACWSARSHREHMESLGHPHPPAHFTGEETEASTVAPQQILGTPPPPLPPSWTHPQGRQGADLVHGQRRLLVVLSRGAELQEGVVDAKKRGVMNWGVGAAQAPPCWAVFGGREPRIEQHQKDCNKSFHPSRHIPEAPVRPAHWGMGSAKKRARCEGRCLERTLQVSVRGRQSRKGLLLPLSPVPPSQMGKPVGPCLGKPACRPRPCAQAHLQRREKRSLGECDQVRISTQPPAAGKPHGCLRPSKLVLLTLRNG